MSIIVSNMNMPSGCQKCKFFKKHLFGNGLDYSYSCILGAKDFPMPWIRQMEERASDCPIEPLEQECISRTDMLDAIGHGTTYTSDDLQGIVKDLPSANRESGKWLLDEEQNHIEFTYHCSECGATAWGKSELTKYCYNCGSKMEVENEKCKRQNI